MTIVTGVQMERFGTEPSFVVATSDGADDSNYNILSDFLHRVRETLSMDVVFVSEFTEGRRAFRMVDTADGETAVCVGNSDPLEESYCQRVVDGRLPMAIQDAMALPEARAIPATEIVGVGAHLSVPIVLRNGKVFGTLCCFSHEAQPHLGSDDVAALRAVADLVAAGIDKHGLFRSRLWPEAPRSAASAH